MMPVFGRTFREKLAAEVAQSKAVVWECEAE
jgi:hypothetical protein